MSEQSRLNVPLSLIYEGWSQWKICGKICWQILWEKWAEANFVNYEQEKRRTKAHPKNNILLVEKKKILNFYKAYCTVQVYMIQRKQESNEERGIADQNCSDSDFPICLGCWGIFEGQCLAD